MTITPEQIWQVIRDFNSTLPPEQHLTDDACKAITILIKRTLLLQPDVPETLGLAALAQESRYWPQALNDNGHPDELTQHDVGIAQLHIASILTQSHPELATPQAAVKFALNPQLAIPYSFGLLARHIRLAKTLTWGKGADPRAHNPYYAAAILYNAGQRGGLRDLASNSAPEHGVNVAHKEMRIAAALGLPSVMADVA